MNKDHVIINSLNVYYGGSSVLKNVQLKMKEGEFVSIVGKSGIGKTTLLNAISGLLEYTGEIKKPEKIAMVFQNYSLFPWLTVEENIEFGMDKKEGKSKRLVELLELVELGGKEKQYPYELSGGQRQRVALARAIATEPEVLLLDEPFGSLDYYTRSKMQEWLSNLLVKNRITTILVTHDIEEAMFLSDRVAILNNKTLENECCLPFIRPRDKEIKFTQEFQDMKRNIMNQAYL